jgi:hypothetical protein
LDGDEMHCITCGELFPIPSGAIKPAAVKINKPEPICSTKSAPDIPDNFSKEREYMKNKLSDLSNHLFEQMERLNTDELTGDKLKAEVERSRAMTGIAKEIINNSRLTLDAMVAIKEHKISLPKMLEMTPENAK